VLCLFLFGRLTGLLYVAAGRELSAMDRCDRELLDKQLRALSPPHDDRAVALTVAAAFFVGTILGGILSLHEPTRIASDDAAASLLDLAPVTVDAQGSGPGT
jgi:hypothetical protein